MIKQAHRYLLLSLLFSFCALLAAAGPSASRSFAMASSSQTIEWNPLRTYSAIEAQLYTAVYEGLLSYNPSNLRPVPGAAASWDLSADKLTYTFHIRPEACFWDGEALSAAVFRDSWLKLLNPATASPFAGLLDPIKGAAAFRTGKSKNPDSVGIKALDSQTLQISLERASAHFLQVVCHQSLVPLHPKHLNRRDWSKVTEIIGNGPFMFSPDSQPNALVLIPNPRYWDHSSLLIDQLRIDFKDEPSLVSQGFNSGEYDWIESGADYDSISNPSSFQLTPQFSTMFLYFSAAKPAFANPLVRKGLIQLLPLEELRSKDLFLVPSANLVPEIPYYPKAKSLDKQDIAAGLKSLEEAGFPNGKNLPPIVVELPKQETWTKLAALMKEAWKGLQTKVEFREIESELYFDQLDPAKFTMASISWIGDYADPLTFLDLWQSQSSLNRSAYANKEFDQLLDESSGQQGQARYRSLAKAEELLLLGGAVVPINHMPAINFIDLDRIGGWFENPLNVHPFKYLQFKALKPPRNVASL